MKLGKVGVWQGGWGLEIAEDRALAATAESLGYGTLWFGEAPGGKEAFVRAATLLGATATLTVATGIASIWGRDPLATASAIRTLGEAFPRRFVAGLGVSHAPLVAARGAHYHRPLSVLRDYLTAMKAAEHSSPAPPKAPPVLLAALRPRMLELAADSADGAHPYFVPVEHTVRARHIMGRDAILAPELAVVLESDPDTARRIARSHTGSFYLSASNYVENLRWLGYGDDDFVDGGSDRLVDALVAWGDDAAIAERVQAHLDAGADHVAIQVITGQPAFGTPGHLQHESVLGVLRRLAPALTTLS